MVTKAKKPANYSVEEETHMWKFILDVLRRREEDPVAYQNQPLGQKLWEGYGDPFKTGRNSDNTRNHFRNKMIVKLHRADLPLADMVKLYQKLCIKLQPEVTKQLEYRFNAKIIVSADGVVERFKEFPVGVTPRTPTPPPVEEPPEDVQPEESAGRPTGEAMDQLLDAAAEVDMGAFVQPSADDVDVFADALPTMEEKQIVEEVVNRRKRSGQRNEGEAIAKKVRKESLETGGGAASKKKGRPPKIPVQQQLAVVPPETGTSMNSDKQFSAKTFRSEVPKVGTNGLLPKYTDSITVQRAQYRKACELGGKVLERIPYSDLDHKLMWCYIYRAVRNEPGELINQFGFWRYFCEDVQSDRAPSNVSCHYVRLLRKKLSEAPIPAPMIFELYRILKFQLQDKEVQTLKTLHDADLKLSSKNVLIGYVLAADEGGVEEMDRFAARAIAVGYKDEGKVASDAEPKPVRSLLHAKAKTAARAEAKAAASRKNRSKAVSAPKAKSPTTFFEPRKPEPSLADDDVEMDDDIEYLPPPFADEVDDDEYYANGYPEDDSDSSSRLPSINDGNLETKSIEEINFTEAEEASLLQFLNGEIRRAKKLGRDVFSAKVWRKFTSTTGCPVDPAELGRYVRDELCGCIYKLGLPFWMVLQLYKRLELRVNRDLVELIERKFKVRLIVRNGRIVGEDNSELKSTCSEKLTVLPKAVKVEPSDEIE